jgi:hypothetical protein
MLPPIFHLFAVYLPPNSSGGCRLPFICCPIRPVAAVYLLPKLVRWLPVIGAPNLSAVCRLFAAQICPPFAVCRLSAAQICPVAAVCRLSATRSLEVDAPLRVRQINII